MISSIPVTRWGLGLRAQGPAQPPGPHMRPSRPLAAGRHGQVGFHQAYKFVLFCLSESFSLGLTIGFVSFHCVFGVMYQDGPGQADFWFWFSVDSE